MFKRGLSNLRIKSNKLFINDFKIIKRNYEQKEKLSTVLT